MLSYRLERIKDYDKVLKENSYYRIIDILELVKKLDIKSKIY